MKKYLKTHEWAELDGKIATVGISNHAQEQLGDVVYVNLPEVGKTVKAGEVFCSVESVKSASDVYAPVSGKIKEVNKALESTPELINKSAEGDGWIAKIEVSNPKEFDNLLDKAAYDKFVKESE
ncbi:glycine cleavage system protein GcvH [Athalassotoga saccharophila]|uniref:glycine cleavage system protein GcvH n=1 Tax=Athalassotoga saccharophila TaxID=1441386 RepID=UPI00137998CC|nr:glycine cleavage system protein GcvH [Athalassotoga saccharophila]BBJ28252.1 glycine cleavage system H protein [Athalassotoga saccharophila]